MKLQNFFFKDFILLFKIFVLGLQNKKIIMAKVLIEKSIPEQIKEVLVSRGTKQTWLASQVELSDEHISNILADRVLLTDDVLDRINIALGTNFKK